MSVEKVFLGEPWKFAMCKSERRTWANVNECQLHRPLIYSVSRKGVLKMLQEKEGYPENK
jgi:hypothetical protein